MTISPSGVCLSVSNLMRSSICNAIVFVSIALVSTCDGRLHVSLFHHFRTLYIKFNDANFQAVITGDVGTREAC